MTAPPPFSHHRASRDHSIATSVFSLLATLSAVLTVRTGAAFLCSPVNDLDQRALKPDRGVHGNGREVCGLRQVRVIH
jgi:hypothetical protein